MNIDPFGKGLGVHRAMRRDVHDRASGGAACFARQVRRKTIVPCITRPGNHALHERRADSGKRVAMRQTVAIGVISAIALACDGVMSVTAVF